MGREIRRVIPNWEHPKKREFNWKTQEYDEVYQRMYDSPYIEALNEWIAEHQRWESGEHEDQKKDYYTPKEYPYYASLNGNPPVVEYYRPNWKPEEAMWYQLYETVSEGTPVTPPFATKEELIEYLVANGDFWDQDRRKAGDSIMPCAPWPRQQAEAFVNGPGWAPSLVFIGGNIQSGVEFIASQQEKFE